MRHPIQSSISSVPAGGERPFGGERQVGRCTNCDGRGHSADQCPSPIGGDSGYGENVSVLLDASVADQPFFRRESWI